jgi:hypothetical protein
MKHATLLLCALIFSTRAATAADSINLFEMLPLAQLDKDFCELVPNPGQGGGEALQWKIGASAQGKVNMVAIPMEGTSLEGVSTIHITAASSSDTAGSIIVVIATRSSDSNMDQMSGYSYLLPIDWTGEKEIKIPIPEFRPFNSPAGLGETLSFYLMNAGFGAKVDDESALLTISKIIAPE